MKIEIDIKYITDEMIDAMLPDEAIELLKSILYTMRQDVGSNDTEEASAIKNQDGLAKPIPTQYRSTLLDCVGGPNMYADQIDADTTIEEALKIVSKPSDFTNDMRKKDAERKVDNRKVEIEIPWSGGKELCPYRGVRYASRQDTFMSRVGQVLISKRKDPVHVALMYDIFCNEMGYDNEDHPRNYDSFKEVNELRNSMSDEELSDMRQIASDKVKKIRG